MEVLFASVPVTDLDAAVRWYATLFGRPPEVVPNDDEAMWRVTDGGWLYVIRDAQRAGRAVVTIAVSNLEHFVGDLKVRGVQIGPIEPIGDAGWKATAVDADGNEISLIEVVAKE